MARKAPLKTKSKSRSSVKPKTSPKLFIELTKLECDVLMQLKRTAVWDGDVVAKPARTSLIRKGLVMRDRKFTSGPYAGTAMNELSVAGRRVAKMLVDQASLAIN